jgi:hypothetical protein
MRTRANLAAALLFCTTTAVSPAAGPAPAATRADLAIDLARVTGARLPAAGAARAAADLLRPSGIDLGADLERPVTRELLVEIGRAIGVTVVGAKADAPVSRAMGQAFATSIRGSLQTALVRSQGGTAMTHVSCQGRESREGRKGTPASPANPNATAPPCEEPIP